MLQKTVISITYLILVLSLKWGYSQVQPNDPLFSHQWGHSNVSAQWAWSLSTGTREIVVAVIGTGVNWNHEDLDGKIWNNLDEDTGDDDDDNNGYNGDIRGYDFFDDDADPDDEFYRANEYHGHESIVAGIIAADINNNKGIAGLCDKVKIMPLRVTNPLAESYPGDQQNLAGAINYAVDNGADIINASLRDWSYNQNVYDALYNAYNAGILVITSAGNSDKNIDQNSNYPSSYALDNIIPVMASTSSDGLWYNSNYGINTVDIAAPGFNIIGTTKNNAPDLYYKKTGTSFAAPYVSGALALLYSSCHNELHEYRLQNPTQGALYFKNLLLESVDPITEFSGLCASGGRLNIYTALQRAQKSIILANKRDNNDQDSLGGTLSLFNLSNSRNIINHQSSLTTKANVFLGHTYDSRTDQKELIIGSTTLRHLNWNRNEEEFRFYHKNYLMTTLKTEEIAWFRKQSEITISSDKNIQLEFRDSWYVEGNETVEDDQPNTFHDIILNNPYSVFLNQNPNFIPNEANYELRAPESKSKETHDITIDWYFNKWTGNNVNFENPLKRQSNIVFTDDGASIHANYKGHLASNSINAISSNNQRIIAYDDNTANKLHMIYEDDGEIYYTYSNDNGTLWVREERISDGEGNNKYPSLVIDNSIIVCTWQKYMPSNYGCIILRTNDAQGWSGEKSITMFLMSESFKSTPVVQKTVTSFKYAVVWKDSLYACLRISVYNYNTGNFENTISVPNTNSNSYYPSLSQDKSNDNHLVWAQSGNIFYSKFDYSGTSYFWEDVGNNLNLTDNYTSISANNYPSITNIYLSEKPVVVWEGTENATSKRKIYALIVDSPQNSFTQIDHDNFEGSNPVVGSSGNNDAILLWKIKNQDRLASLEYTSGSWQSFGNIKTYIANGLRSPQLTSGDDHLTANAVLKYSTEPYIIRTNFGPKIVLPPTLDVDIYNYYQIRLSITHTADDIDKYKIYRKKDSGSYSLVATINCSGETTTWIDPNVNSSFQVNTFCYKVKAVDDYGIVSDYSNEDCEQGKENMFKIGTDETNVENILPSEYAVSAYPNPFNPATNFKVSLPEAGNISLKVYNSLGQVIFEITEHREAGFHNFSFNGRNLTTGLYFYSLQVNSFHTTGKVLLIK